MELRVRPAIKVSLEMPDLLEILGHLELMDSLALKELQELLGRPVQ